MENVSKLNVPQPVWDAIGGLFERLPLARAMEKLVVVGPPEPELVALVDQTLRIAALRGRKPLAAGLWLYIDDLERSHKVSQELKDATGSFWHGIMHRREGDFSNSHYWFDRAGGHPAMAAIGQYDPHQFIDDVCNQHRESPQSLIRIQRDEWCALFSWCANR